MGYPQRGEAMRPHLRVESFVNPGARCPSCGSAVFYYQSPNGGRVYFDELGPPWPKHPCTTRSAAATPRTGRTLVPRTGPYGWQIAGWLPYLLDTVTSYSPALVQIGGQLNGEELQLYLLKRDLHATTDPREFLQVSVIQCKRLHQGKPVF